MEKILVFGMGKMYREKEDYLRAHYEIAGCIDNKAAELRKNTCDIPGACYKNSLIFIKGV